MEEFSDLLKLLREIEDSDEPVSRIKLARYYYNKKLFKLSIRELLELKGRTDSLDRLIDSAISLLGGVGTSNISNPKVVAEIKV